MSDDGTTQYDSEIPGHVFVRCRDCGTILHLGPGWRGREPPQCPSCDVDDEYEWEDDPRVTMQKFLALVDE